MAVNILRYGCQHFKVWYVNILRYGLNITKYQSISSFSGISLKNHLNISCQHFKVWYVNILRYEAHVNILRYGPQYYVYTSISRRNKTTLLSAVICNIQFHLCSITQLNYCLDIWIKRLQSDRSRPWMPPKVVISICVRWLLSNLSQNKVKSPLSLTKYSRKITSRKILWSLGSNMWERMHIVSLIPRRSMTSYSFVSDGLKLLISIYKPTSMVSNRSCLNKVLARVKSSKMQMNSKMI